MRNTFLCVILLFGWTGRMPSHAREWIDATGESKFEAELISVGPDSVRLLIKENNTEYDIPLRLLSKADRDYVGKQAKAVDRRKSPVTSVPSSVLSSIREKAELAWPGNYNMQKYEIDNQRKGYIAVANYSDRSIPPRILTEIMAKAKAEWAGNYNMQKYEIDNQVNGYKAVNNYRAAGIPSNVLNQIIQKALREWPGNYNMQKYEIDNQVKAYTELH